MTLETARELEAMADAMRRLAAAIAIDPAINEQTRAQAGSARRRLKQSADFFADLPVDQPPKGAAP